MVDNMGKLLYSIFNIWLDKLPTTIIILVQKCNKFIQRIRIGIFALIILKICIYLLIIIALFKYILS